MALLVSLAAAMTTAAISGDEHSPTGPQRTELTYSTLGSRLDQLVAQVQVGQASPQEAAEDSLIHQDESVAVTIHLSGHLPNLVQFLDDNGGDPRNVGRDYIEGYVPVTLLGQLSEQPGVLRVREIVPPLASQIPQQIIGHGPPVHGSVAWNDEGYSGQGVKVGVIDAGFDGFRDLMGTELPATVRARCYTGIALAVPLLEVCETVSYVIGVFTRFGDHGT